MKARKPTRYHAAEAREALARIDAETRANLEREPALRGAFAGLATALVRAAFRVAAVDVLHRVLRKRFGIGKRPRLKGRRTTTRPRLRPRR